MKKYPGLTVQLHNRTLDVHIGRYPNGRVAIELFDPAINEPWCTATVNMPEYRDFNGLWVFIKDYSENEGALEALVTAGVVSPPKAQIPAGFTEIHICEILHPDILKESTRK